MSLTIYTNNDSSDSAYGTSGVTWTEIDTSNDRLIFTDGSVTVADGEASPSQDNLNQAGTLISATVEVEVGKCFLDDVGSNLLREIDNFGNVNKRYVFAFSFDAATASEPILELWDDSNLNTVANESLGAGTPSNSWWKGVVTTSGLPGADWAGGTPVTLAGSTVSHYLELNDGNGALALASVLYCNLAILIPAGASYAGQENNVLVCKYTSN